MACCWALGCGSPEEVGDDLSDDAAPQEREPAWFSSGLPLPPVRLLGGLRVVHLGDLV